MTAFSRRTFLSHAGVLGSAAVLAQVPGLLRLRGWSDPAYAQQTDLVRDTLNALVSFIVPGGDAYSKAQGNWTKQRGALAARTTDALIASLDEFLPAPDGPGVANDETMPLSGAIANLLNVIALQVNPGAANGTFVSPFARLSFAEKVAVFEALEADSGAPDAELPQPFTEATGNFAFVAGILPGFVAFLAYGEWHVFDASRKRLRRRPVGWDLADYQPGRIVPAEGWNELRGYYQGRRRVGG